MKTADGWTLCDGVVGKDSLGRDKFCRRTIAKPGEPGPEAPELCPRCWTPPPPMAEELGQGKLTQRPG